MTRFFLKDFYSQQMRSTQRIKILDLMVYLIIIIWYIEKLLPLYFLELICQNFNIVMDTALDKPDAKELARISNICGNITGFTVIYCPVEEGLKSLKMTKKFKLNTSKQRNTVFKLI